MPHRTLAPPAREVIADGPPPSQALLPGWGPLVEPPRRLQAAAVLRWWWPTAAVAGFLVLVAVVGGRDDPAPGLSMRGLVTLTLAAPP